MSNTGSSYSEQSEGAAPQPRHEAPVGFFAIGIVINLVLLAAFFVWAYRQWKKPRPGDDSRDEHTH